MNEDVFERRGSEGVRLTHPPGHETLPTRLRDVPAKSRAPMLLLRTDDHPLNMQRSITVFPKSSNIVPMLTSPTKLDVRSDSLTRSYPPGDMVLARTFVTIRSCGRCFLSVQFGPHTPPGLLSETSMLINLVTS